MYTGIFRHYPRVMLRLGDESWVFDAGRLMYTELATIERCTGLSYMEWHRELRRFSVTAIAALIHVLRQREGQPSDYATMQFNAAELAVLPLHEDGSEFTDAEVADDLRARVRDAEAALELSAAGSQG